MVRGNLQESMEYLRGQFIDLMATVDSQVELALEALVTGNIDMAELVDEKEKTVNKKELLIDKECEKNLALYGPVANDLRFILSIVEMNTHLERIGDLMQTIALNIIETPDVCSKELLDRLGIDSHFAALSETFKDAIECFTEESMQKASHIFITDRHIKKALRRAKHDLVEMIKKNPKNALLYVNTHTNMRMLIRFADMIDNLLEEMIFYLEAVVLKHKKKKHKKIRAFLDHKEEENKEAQNPSTNDPGSPNSEKTQA